VSLVFLVISVKTEINEKGQDLWMDEELRFAFNFGLLRLQKADSPPKPFDTPFGRRTNIFNMNPALQKATAAIPCARTASGCERQRIWRPAIWRAFLPDIAGYKMYPRKNRPRIRYRPRAGIGHQAVL
jgi:hypothetical protein